MRAILLLIMTLIALSGCGRSTYSVISGSLACSQACGQDEVLGGPFSTELADHTLTNYCVCGIK